MAEAASWRDPAKPMPRGHESCGAGPGFGPRVEPTREAAGALDYTLSFGGDAGRHIQVTAGEVGAWVFRFRPAGVPIAPGGSIRLFREANNMVLARGMQRHDPAGEHYTTLRRAGPGSARFRYFAGDGKGFNASLKDNVCAVIEVADAPFEAAGDEIVLTIGETSGGALPADAPAMAMFNCRYWIDVDFTGRGLYHRLAPPIVIDVVPGQAARLRAVAPSVVRPGENFRVRAAVEDASCNPWVRYAGEMSLLLPDAERRSVRVVEDDWGFTAFEDVRLLREGVYRLEVSSADGRLRGVTNPVLCSSCAPRVAWGDTHNHTWANDGQGSVEHNFRFARDVAFLDFFALADHCHCVDYAELHLPGVPVEPLPRQTIVMRESTAVYWLPFYVTFEEHMAECRAWAERLSRDREFVAFLGYEWQPLAEDMGPRVAHARGDWCVLYRDIEARPSRPLKLEEVFALLGPDRAVATPHHGGRRDSLTGFAQDPAKAPSVEVASMHDRSEWLGQKALALGWKAGFHGASDGHMGRPGYDVWPPKGGGGPPFRRRYEGERSAVTAVIADETTREEIWRNWLSRRHYATTGPRILLDVRCGETPMGGEVRTDRPPTLRVRVHGTAAVARVEVIRGDQLAHAAKPDAADVDLAWTDPDPLPGESAYYVRITQRDDALAWSSPIYVTFTGPRAGERRELPAWNAAAWPDEADAQRDADIEARAMEVFRRRCQTMEGFEELRAVGLHEDVRGRYVLIRGRLRGAQAQWKVYWEFPDARICGKPGKWNTHG